MMLQLFQVIVMNVLNQANQRDCMLMDFVREENCWPSLKHVDQVPLSEYIGKLEDKQKQYLESKLSNSRITAKVLIYDALLFLCKKDLRAYCIRMFSSSQT